MGLTLYLGMERGNIACHKSEARFGTLLREGRLASRASRDEAFWRSQVNFGPPNPATDDKALWSKGKRVRCHTPCLPKVPRGRARRSRATTREKQNEIRIWPKKKQGYGYHDRSPSRKKNLSKSLRVSGAFKHPKYAGIVNDIAFLTYWSYNI